jgi:hypothetical protein
LSYPDPSAEFFGFNQSRHTVGEPAAPSTERLIYSVVRIAGARLTAKTGVATFSKRSTVQAYAEQVADEWAGFVSEVFGLCHDEWRSLIPAAAADRARLQTLYGQVLGFENHYLELYRQTFTDDLALANAGLG